MTRYIPSNFRKDTEVIRQDVSLLPLLRNDTNQIRELEIEMTTPRFQAMQPTQSQPQVQPQVQSRATSSWTRRSRTRRPFLTRPLAFN